MCDQTNMFADEEWRKKHYAGHQNVHPSAADKKAMETRGMGTPEERQAVLDAPYSVAQPPVRGPSFIEECALAAMVELMREQKSNRSEWLATQAWAVARAMEKERNNG